MTTAATANGYEKKGKEGVPDGGKYPPANANY